MDSARFPNKDLSGQRLALGAHTQVSSLLTRTTGVQ